MFKIVNLLIFSVVAFGCAKENADRIFVNTSIYTLNPANETANSVAVKDGRILFVGDEEKSYEYSDENTQLLDLKGMTLIPGLTDAHAHIGGTGKFLQTLNFHGTTSASEIVSRVKSAANRTPPGEWIEGRGWDQNDWKVKKFPTSALLDKVTPNNPVAFRRVDGHAYWVNQKVLDLAGITSETPDPDGGRIIRLPNSNTPSGILIDNAMLLISDIIPTPSLELKKRRIVQALSYSLKLGLTTIHDASTDSDEVAIYTALASEGRLNPRVYVMLDDEKKLKEKQFKIGPQIGLFNNHLTIRTIKLYADGALGSRGALLLEPYSDDPDNSGLAVTPESELRASFAEGIKHGFQIAIHAIGDSGNRLVLDIVEDNLDLDLQKNHRSRIEHAQILSLDDILRFNLLGVIPSMQPTHGTSDMPWAEDRIGSERIKGAYAWRKLLDTGVLIPGGSDSPVESLNPLWGIYSAVTRQDHEGYPEGGWQPEERMTMEEAVKMFSAWAAYASFEEDLKGTIEVGKLADFTILSKDIFKEDPRVLLETKVLMTVIGGEIMYDILLKPDDLLLAEE